VGDSLTRVEVQNGASLGGFVCAPE
jgi:hypothetical protein